MIRSLLGWRGGRCGFKHPTFVRTQIMNSRNSRFVPGCRSLSRFLATGAMVGLTLCASVPANAAFHLWTIREVYTDASGTLQFIELFDPSGGQPLVNGQSI